MVSKKYASAGNKEQRSCDSPYGSCLKFAHRYEVEQQVTFNERQRGKTPQLLLREMKGTI